MSAKVLQMEYDLIELAKWNGFNPSQFVNFLIKHKKEVIIIKGMGDEIPDFVILANDVLPCVNLFKRSKLTFLQKFFKMIKR